MTPSTAPLLWVLVDEKRMTMWGDFESMAEAMQFKRYDPDTFRDHVAMPLCESAPLEVRR